MPYAISAAEVARLLAEPEPERSPLLQRSEWVDMVVAGAPAVADLDALCEVAAEAPSGPLDAIRALLRGLALRHDGDDATQAALTAVLHLHLPNLLDAAQGAATPAPDA